VLRSVPRRRTLIIGSGAAATLVADKIERHPELDLNVVGFVDEGPRKSVRGRSEPLLGGISELTTIIEQRDVEVAILGYTVNNTKDILGALYLVEPKVDVLMMPRYFEFVSAGMKVDDLAGMPLLRLNRRAPSSSEVVAKRIEDIVLGGLFSLFILPFVPIIALAIKIDSPGPIIFKHRRIGKNGRPFDLYKFRSMRADADCDVEALDRLADEDPRALKNREDVRMTRVGYYLRKFSIDELPQFFNVLKGDMSLVGPRPPVAEEVASYEEWQKKRLAMSPGITGIWQVNGRSDLPFDERIWLDFMYIDSWSVWLDVRIILQTIPAVLSTKGAY
jgi:exopolysaccharide biosynthesis polyprenyl glycosylphosphotransferase